MLRVALLPASVLSLVLLAKLSVTFMSLPWICRSSPYLFSFWNDGLSEFTLFTMLLVMFLAGGIALIALMRGFVILKATNVSSQSDIKPSFT